MGARPGAGLLALSSSSPGTTAGSGQWVPAIRQWYEQVANWLVAKGQGPVVAHDEADWLTLDAGSVNVVLDKKTGLLKSVRNAH